ncbi:MAG: DNA polymerase III subunit gamma/tau [Oleibacter sp.]|nr:DNA polymerase III subunit gamma/tau [Thalassolituus sp.]
MSYQVLARKWRPRFFDEMVGQEHVLRALINGLNEGRLHHAYLFTGTRGVGKTTIARILAKCLNCEQGVSARPCGECSSCKEIAEGRFVDLIEVDAASRTRIEDTRELLDNVQYAPTRGRYKVYLIDEVHMLSTHSFNALLKTLEEPPEHVKFLLATTDPQKLPVTILSRCLQFSLKNMTPERIVHYLMKVLDAEKIPFEEPALWSLGRAAQGSMRDGLSLTDQAIAYGEGQVGESQVNAMLGTMDRGRLFKLAEIMAQGDARAIMAEIASMAEHSPDYDEVLQGLLQIWHRASMAQVVPEAIDNTEGDRDAILQLGMAMAAEDLQLYYQIALQGRKDLMLAPDPRQGFEMIMLRMLAFRPAPDQVPELDLQSALQKKKPLAVEFTSSSKSSQEHDSDDEPVSQSESATEINATAELQSKVTTELDPLAATTDISDNDMDRAFDEPLADDTVTEPLETNKAFESAQIDENSPKLQSEDTASRPQTNAPSSPAIPSIVSPKEPKPKVQTTDTIKDKPQTSAAQPTSNAQEVHSKPAPLAAAAAPELPHMDSSTWWQWCERLPLAGMPLSIAKNSALITVDDDILVLDVDPAQSALYNDSQRVRVEDAIRTLRPNTKIVMELRPPRGETPEQRRQRYAAEANYAARHAIDSDPLVNQILSELGGVVLEETVRPIS